MPFINQAAISTGGVTVSQNTDFCILQQVDEQQWQQMNVKAQVIWLGTKLQLENITTTELDLLSATVTLAVCHGVRRGRSGGQPAEYD